VDFFARGENSGEAAIGFLQLVAGLYVAAVNPAFAEHVEGVFGGGVEGLFDAGRGADGDDLQVIGRADEGFFDVAE